MTGVSFVLVTLAVAGVFAAFWWLVELSGGAAAGAVSVCRSMQTGFLSWRESQDETPLEPVVANDDDRTLESGGHGALPAFDDGFHVPVTLVRGRPKHKRF